MTDTGGFEAAGRVLPCSIMPEAAAGLVGEGSGSAAIVISGVLPREVPWRAKVLVGRFGETENISDSG